MKLSALFALIFLLPGCYSTVQYYKRAEQLVGHGIETGVNKALQCEGVNKDKNFCKDYPPTNKPPEHDLEVFKVDGVPVPGAKEIAPTLEVMPWSREEEVLPLPPIMTKPLPEHTVKQEEVKKEEPKKVEPKKKKKTKKKPKKKVETKPADKPAQGGAAGAEVKTPEKEFEEKAPQPLIPSAREIEATP